MSFQDKIVIKRARLIKAGRLVKNYLLNKA